MPRFVIKGFVWDPPAELELDEPRYTVVRVLDGTGGRAPIPESGFPFEFESDADFGIEMEIPDTVVDSVSLYSRVSMRPSVLYPAVDDFGPMLERTYTVLFRKTGRPRMRVELLVYYKLEDDRAGLTTPPALPDRIDREVPERKSSSVTLSSPSPSTGSPSASASVLDEADPFRYLVMPGNYSGDSWAVAFALLLDARVKVALPTKASESTSALSEASGEVEQVDDSSIFVRTTLQFWNLCVALRIGDLEHRVLIRTSLVGQQVGESAVATAAEAIISSDIGTLDQPTGATFCGWTFASSSVILHAAERRGLGVVLREIRTTVTRGVTLTDHLPGVLGKIASAKPCVLINMRIGRRGNHPQHDINLALYTQIVEAVIAAGFLPIRIGTYQNSEYTPGGQWMADLTEPVVEIFPPGAAANRQQIATFWHEVSKLTNVFGIIGGRSGSLDIAAIMGVRTLCWDIVDPLDQEYIRQLLYAPFMSICPRSSAELTTAIKNKTTPMPGYLSAAALALWLAGHAVVPRRRVDPEGAFLQLFKLAALRDAETRKRIFLRDVAFMRLFQGASGSGGSSGGTAPSGGPRGLYDEARGRVRASTGTVYDVGRAPGGGNCFYHCIAQIVNDGRDHALLRQALAASGNVAQAGRVGTDGQDATDGDIAGMATTLHRPIVVHTVAYNATITREQTIGSHETGVPIHILHRYDPIDGRGHYDPMTPRT